MRRSIFPKLLKWTFVLGLWCGIFFFGLLAWYAMELPSITKSANFERKTSITVKAADGSVIGRYGDIKGENVKAEDLPENLIHAVLAIEDRRFYSHGGIDFRGVARAMLTNAAKGKLAQGGSTITQQLAKNLFLSQERTFKRKIQEALLAFWLERKLTKDEILSAYLNRVYMGGGAYGVAAASELYYGKSVKDLNLEQCATIAGLLKAPSRYSPTNNPSLSRQRAEIVLKAMADIGYITEKEAKSYASRPPVPPKRPIGGDSSKYYADWIVDSLQDLIGTPEEDIIVETSLDPDIQKTAAKALVSVIGTSGAQKNISQGAAVAIRPNGAVVAMVGGYDYATSQFNRATQARRQPGSSFKPFVYLAAIEDGWSPLDIVYDGPITEGRYRPKNFGNEYYGDVTLETALAFSLNTVTFRLMKTVGPAHVIDVARRLGITSELNPELSLGLGTASLAPLEMAAAYASLAGGGLAIRPYGILRIKGAKGGLLYERPVARDAMRVASPADIGILTGMLRNVIEYGTGQRARLPFAAYGKTGTSQDSRDAWFIGYTPEIAAAVWMGNDDYSPMKHVTGGSFPADVWRQVMINARGKYPPSGGGEYSSYGFEGLMERILSSVPAAGANLYGPEEQDMGMNQTGAEIPSSRIQRKPSLDQFKKLPGSSHYND